MARIPVIYAQTPTLQSGGAVAVQNTDGGLGQAMQGFGGAVEKYAQVSMQNTAKNDMFVTNVDYAKTKNELNQINEQYSKGMAQNPTPEYQKEWQTKQEEVISKFHTSRPNYLQNKIAPETESLRTESQTFVRRTQEQQVQKGAQEGIKITNDKAVGDALSHIAAGGDPSKVDEIIKKQQNVIDISPIAEAEKAQKRFELDRVVRMAAAGELTKGQTPERMRELLGIAAPKSGAGSEPTVKQDGGRGALVGGEVGGIIANVVKRDGGNDADVANMQRIAMLESGGNPSAKNKSSSAGGLFQQIDSNAKANGVANRYDANESTVGAFNDYKRNKASLAGILGREPTGGELYLAHQQGAGGAKALLLNPSAKAVDVLRGIKGEEHLAEKKITLNGGNLDMTAGDFAGLWAGKFSGDGKGSSIPTAHPLVAGLNYQDRQALFQQGEQQFMKEKQNIIGDYSLGIAKGLVTSSDNFEKDSRLSSSDKAGLLSQFNSKQGDNRLSEFGQGAIFNKTQLNPYDKDHVKGVDLAFTAQTGGKGVFNELGKVDIPKINGVIESVGFIPPKAATQLQGLSLSRNADQRIEAYGAISAIISSKPTAFYSTSGFKDSEELAISFQDKISRLGYTSQKADAAIQEGLRLKQEGKLPNDKELKKDAERIDASTIKGQFKAGSHWFSNADLPQHETQKSMMVDDYRDLYTDFRKSGHDDGAAKLLATKQLGSIWGVTKSMGKEVLTKYPAETAKGYPEVNGSKDYIQRQAAEEVGAKTGLTVKPDQIYLVPIKGITEREHKEGVPPAYQVLFTKEVDGVKVIDSLSNMIFRADPQKEWKSREGDRIAGQIRGEAQTELNKADFDVAKAQKAASSDFIKNYQQNGGEGVMPNVDLTDLRSKMAVKNAAQAKVKPINVPKAPPIYENMSSDQFGSAAGGAANQFVRDNQNAN